MKTNAVSATVMCMWITDVWVVMLPFSELAADVFEVGTGIRYPVGAA
jgi:hypothetical protein